MVRATIRWRWAVVAGWAVVAALSMLLLPSLASVVRNDNAEFLPSTAPSVRAQSLASPFVRQGTPTGVIVIEASAGTAGRGTEGVLAEGVLAAALGEVRRAPLVLSATPEAVAGGGRVLTAEVQFAPVTDGAGSAGARAVAGVRQALSKTVPAGMQAYLTGSLPELVDQQHAAGRTADSVAVVSVLVILLLLLITLRSALASLLALAPPGLALAIASPLIAESTHVGVQISSLLQVLLTALVLGAGTDYGLFVVFRVRESLEHGRPPEEAITEAVSRVGATVVFSATTVVFALLSLLLASFGLYRGVGPGLAIGIVVVLLVDLTLLPALLAIFGRAAFWPRRLARRGATRGWARVAVRVCRRPLVALGCGTLVLGGLALGLVAYAPSGFNPGGAIPGSGSATGLAILTRYFGITQTSPTDVVLRFRHTVWQAPDVLARAYAGLLRSRQFASVAGALDPTGTYIPPAALAHDYAALGPPQALSPSPPATPPVSVGMYDAYRSTAQYVSPDGRTVLFQTSLSAGSAGSTAAMQAVPRVRQVVARVGRQVHAEASGVAGQAPAAADVSTVSGHDMVQIVPIVLVVLAMLLAIGLGSVVAPLYLVATVGLSYLASLGLAVLIFVVAGGSLGVNFTLPFFLFVFIMALGEDYNILIARRLREESAGAPPKESVRRAMSATGGTITSAGLVLASTFAVLAVATSGQVRQIGTGLALGVLIDTFIVRTLLVPSVASLLGRRNWWPSRLGEAPAGTPGRGTLKAG